VRHKKGKRKIRTFTINTKKKEILKDPFFICKLNGSLKEEKRFD
jgi:tRNA 2-selenouridine synthase SelU